MLPFTPEHRELPTPCSDFTVHDLVEHLMGSLRSLGGDGRGGDPRADPGGVGGGLHRPGRRAGAGGMASPWIEGEVPFGSGTVPAVVPAGILSLEFFIHAWDFARATDQPFSLVPEPLAAFVTNIAEQIIQPSNRGDGKGFAEIAAPVHDDAVSKLMAFTGRTT